MVGDFGVGGDLDDLHGLLIGVEAGVEGLFGAAVFVALADDLFDLGGCESFGGGCGEFFFVFYLYLLFFEERRGEARRCRRGFVGRRGWNRYLGLAASRAQENCQDNWGWAKGVPLHYLFRGADAQGYRAYSLRYAGTDASGE